MEFEMVINYEKIWRGGGLVAGDLFFEMGIGLFVWDVRLEKVLRRC
jgi:hypothetical protein